MSKLNKNCPGVKRLMREAAEMATPTEYYYAAPLEDNLFEWHFTVRGQSGTSFEGGLYHGRIIFPPEYPLKPPSVILLTPNGRFEINRKICLSISSHHPETWQPSWSIRTVLLAIVGFMPTPGKGAIGALDWTDAERKKLAKASADWSCPTCGSSNATALPDPQDDSSADITAETEKYAAELSFSAEKSKGDQKITSAESEASLASGTLPASPSSAVPPYPAQESPELPLGDEPLAEPSRGGGDPTVEPASPPASPRQQQSRTGDGGGTFSFILMYIIITLISALMLRRFIRTIYAGFFEDSMN